MGNRSYPRLLWGSAAWALMGACAFGYHLGVLNTCIATISTQFGVGELQLSPLATCSMLVGAAVGSLFAGGVADKVGPRGAMLLNNLPLALGALLCMLAWGTWSLCLGRLLAGLGSGAASLFVPRLLAEISPRDVRGALGTQTQVFINIGILLSYLAGLPYQFVGDGWAPNLPLGLGSVEWWRVMMAMALVPSAAQVLFAAGVPESPVWLQWAGHHDRAQAAALRLHGTAAELAGSSDSGGSADGHERLLSDEEDGASSQSAAAAASSASAAEPWSGLLKPRYRWVLALACALPVLQQASGINTVIFYSTQVFQTAGLKSPIAGTLTVGVVNLCFTFVASALMDRAGRKSLILASHGGMAGCLGLMVGAMLLSGPDGGGGKLLAAATFGAILAYIAFFALGVGPIPWLYIGEVLPDAIKGRAGALATSLNWTTNLIVGLTFPRLLAALGIGCYALYALCNVGAVAFLATYMVETRQQSLAQIKARLLLKDKS